MTKPWDVAASEQRKAILGGAVALLTALLSALQDGLAGNEIAAVVVAAAIGYLTVFTTENRPAPKRRKVAGETGHSAIELAIGAVVLIILVVLLLKLV